MFLNLLSIQKFLATSTIDRFSENLSGNPCNANRVIRARFNNSSMSVFVGYLQTQACKCHIWGHMEHRNISWSLTEILPGLAKGRDRPSHFLRHHRGASLPCECIEMLVRMLETPCGHKCGI